VLSKVAFDLQLFEWGRSIVLCGLRKLLVVAALMLDDLEKF